MAIIIDKNKEGSAARTAALLREGKVGVIPCDTIYGLSGCVGEAVAERLYEIKRRPQSKSFITLMAKEDLLTSGLIVPDDILKRWPAPLTAILSDGKGGTHAVRVPDDSYMQQILKAAGPIYSTSVNFSGEKSLLSFEDILPVFDRLVDFIVKDPSVSGGMPSTLIDATSEPYRVLRQGAYII